MVLKAVLDTNAILYLLGGKLQEPLPPPQYFTPVICEIELLSYPALDEAAVARVRGFLSAISLVGLTDGVKETAIQLRRQYSLKIPDSIIVATAVWLQAELLTNDAKLLHLPGVTAKQLQIRQG